MDVTRKTQTNATWKAATLFVLAASLVTSWGCAHHEVTGMRAEVGPAPSYEAQLARAKGARELEEAMGIRLLVLRPTAGGHMIDVRFEVVNPEAAGHMLGEGSKVKFSLVNPATGQSAEVPNTMVGLLRHKARQTRPERIYYILFGNPGMAIVSGSRVNLRFGDVVVEQVPVM